MERPPYALTYTPGSITNPPLWWNPENLNHPPRPRLNRTLPYGLGAYPIPEKAVLTGYILPSKVGGLTLCQLVTPTSRNANYGSSGKTDVHCWPNREALRQSWTPSAETTMNVCLMSFMSSSSRIQRAAVSPTQTFSQNEVKCNAQLKY